MTSISLKHFPLSNDIMYCIIVKARDIFEKERQKKRNDAARSIQLAYWAYYLRTRGYGPDSGHIFDETDHEYAMSTCEGNEAIHDIVMTATTWDEANVRFYALDPYEADDTVVREKIVAALWTKLPNLHGRYLPDDW
jgi:hypothetical protein